MRWVPVAVVLFLALVAMSSAEVPPPADGGPILGPGRIGPPPPEARIRPPRGKALSADEVVEGCVLAAMTRHDTPGAAVAVIDGGEMLVERGFGVKARDGDDPVGADTRFRIGSVTKSMTAAAVLQQVEAGAVGLDDPVTLYVPELGLAGVWPAEWITVHHLLTHTSGYPDNFVSVEGPTADDALSSWAAGQGHVHLHAPPDSFWNYSNPNFSLAGLVVERATGVPYREYMEERVFEAAGLTRTTFDPAVVMADGDWSHGHYDPGVGPEIVYQPDSYDSGAMAPAGFAFSTAGDLARWALLLTDGGGEILTPAAAAAMQSTQAEMEAAPWDRYGYGVMVEDYDGLPVLQHGGNIPGWGTSLLWVPERRAAVAVVANTFESLPDAAYCIVDGLFGTPGGEPLDLEPNRDLWPAFLGRYSGRSSIGVELDLVVAMEGSVLTLDIVNPRFPPDHILRPMAPLFWNTFAVDLDDDGTLDLDFTFHLSEGQPRRVEWLVNRSLVGSRAVPPRAGQRP